MWRGGLGRAYLLAGPFAATERLLRRMHRTCGAHSRTTGNPNRYDSRVAAPFSGRSANCCSTPPGTREHSRSVFPCGERTPTSASTSEDDGDGFDSAVVFKRPGAVPGFGLFNVRERVEYLGGRLEIDSRPGRGTLASLTVSLEGK